MKRKILVLVLTASFAFALVIPTQLPTNTKVSSYLLQHGG